MVTIKLDNVDWAILREQKQWLISLKGTGTITQELYRKGLVHLLDEIQDQAAEQIGNYPVFDAGGAVSAFENPPMACDTCGCLPGEGLTEGCDDPDGCGWSRKMLERGKARGED